MKQALLKTTVILCLLFLSSCASRYAAKSEEGFGYSSKRVSEHVFDIHYKGNAETALTDARKYAYRRAAELTLATGYTHFSIVEEKELSSYPLQKLSDIPGNVQAFTASGGKIENPTYPELQLTIYCSYASESTSGIDARKWMAGRSH